MIVELIVDWRGLGAYPKLAAIPNLADMMVEPLF